MIELYNRGEDTTKNGEILNAIDGSLKVALSSENELEATFLIDESENIANDKLIKVDAPEGKQLYRIYDYIKTSNSIKVYARNKYFDLKEKAIINNVKGTRQQILNTILSGTGYTGKYVGGNTDILTIEGKTNVIEILSSLEEEYIIKDNVVILGRVGADDGYTVEFGYNLDDIEEDISTDDVITRIYPCYQEIIGNPVDSKYINNYPLAHERFIDFEITTEEDDVELTEEQIKTILQEKAKEYFISSECDKPVCNYNVKMINLSETTEYKNYQILETVNLGDTVTCKNKNLNINCKERCISYEWDINDRKYINIELGQRTETYSDRILEKEKNIIQIIDDAKDKAEKDTNNLKVVMEKRDSEIELSVTNEIENRKAEIKVLDGKIEERVTEDDFTAYKSTTAKEISQKISKGTEFSSEMKQNVDAFKFLFHGASDGETTIDSDGITVKCGGFKVINSSGNTVMEFNYKGECIAKYMSATDLNCVNTDKGSTFYSMLYNMELAGFKNLNATKLAIGGQHIYDYIVDVLEDKGLL